MTGIKENKENKNNKKTLLIVAVILAVTGGVIFTVAFAALGFDIAKLSTQKYEFNTYMLAEDFNSIKINTETASVILAASDSDECKIECVEREKMKHTAKVREGTLVIDVENTKKWYDYIGSSFGNETITIYLPKAVYASLSVNADTGSVEIPEMFSFESVCVKVDTGSIDCYADVSNSIELQTARGSICAENSKTDGEVKLKTSTGSIKIADIRCNRLSAESHTGSIDLTNTIADDNMTINCATGSVKFNSCDANEMKVETHTGSIVGTLLSDKIFFAKSAVGNVDVPKTTSGGTCELVTGTGDIKIEIKK